MSGKEITTTHLVRVLNNLTDTVKGSMRARRSPDTIISPDTIVSPDTIISPDARNHTDTSNSTSTAIVNSMDRTQTSDTRIKDRCTENHIQPEIISAEMCMISIQGISVHL